MLFGMQELRDKLEELEELADDAIKNAEVAIHDELVAQMSSGAIPVDTGKLRESLINPGSSDHIFEVTENDVRFGSSNVAVRPQLERIPRIDVKAVIDVIVKGMSDG